VGVFLWARYPCNPLSLTQVYIPVLALLEKEGVVFQEEALLAPL
jgi:hypothetical protein